MADLEIQCPQCEEIIGVDYDVYEPLPATLGSPLESGGVSRAVVVDAGSCPCALDENTLVFTIEQYVLTEEFLDTLEDDDDDDYDAVYDAWHAHSMDIA